MGDHILVDDSMWVNHISGLWVNHICAYSQTEVSYSLCLRLVWPYNFYNFYKGFFDLILPIIVAVAVTRSTIDMETKTSE